MAAFATPSTNVAFATPPGYWIGVLRRNMFMSVMSQMALAWTSLVSELWKAFNIGTQVCRFTSHFEGWRMVHWDFARWWDWYLCCEPKTFLALERKLRLQDGAPEKFEMMRPLTFAWNFARGTFLRNHSSPLFFCAWELCLTVTMSLNRWWPPWHY